MKGKRVKSLEASRVCQPTDIEDISFKCKDLEGVSLKQFCNYYSFFSCRYNYMFI